MLDDCASSPCLNGAECHDGVGMFTCSCSSGYMGTLCDEGYRDTVCVMFVVSIVTVFFAEVYECTSHPCQNNGTCTDLVDGFRCDCVAGYEGVSCGIGMLISINSQQDRLFVLLVLNTGTNECDSLPCQNGGTCFDFHLSFTCQCAVGFVGLLCETSE